MLFVGAAVVGLGAGMQSANAAGELPPEEQQGLQGIFQNLAAYVNLVVNFLFGFWGSLFAFIARELVKPGPTKYFIVFGIVGGFALLVYLIMAMTGSIVVPGYKDPISIALEPTCRP